MTIERTSLNPMRVVTLAAGLVIALIFIVGAFSIVGNVSASQIAVVQYPTGTLRCITTQGPFMQMFGTVTKYDRQDTYSFSMAADQGAKDDESIPVQFSDGAHGKISGTLAWQMPLSCDQIIKLHKVTGTQTAVEQRFIRPVVEKSVYFAGPLMTSKESYSERKGELLSDIEDQMTNGVYRTQIVTAKEPDPITGIEKTVSHVMRVAEGNRFARQDSSPLNEYGIRTYNLEIKVAYDTAVEAQIQEQQKLAMSVQTAMAAAKQAEQRALTVAKEGEASAAAAKWQQEVVKAKNVTEGESKLAVAKLDNDTAEQYRQATLKRADADATYRKRVMEADGALGQRLDAQVKIATVMADAIKNHPGSWTPNVVMGGNANGTGVSSTQQLMDLLTVQAAKSVGLQK
jgi:hypothetical protein